MTSALPSHRQVLSSLITAVCQPPPESSSTLPHNPSLKSSIPPSRRQFLLTLHVLFPTLLLPALDLLDRELVTRLQLVTTEGQETQDRTKISDVYVVKSLASTLKGAQRRGVAKQAPEAKYVVRLTAWNCTCASFALDAYGGSSRPDTVRSGAEKTDQEGSLYGGFLSLGEADVPCCKHLLACLLAENWKAVLGGRVESKSVTREDMAGIVASI